MRGSAGLRVRRAKTRQESGPTPPDTADRTNSTATFSAIFNAYYKPPEELTMDKFKAATKKKNDFKFHSMTVNDKNVEIYIYKKEPYDAAL